MRFVYDPYKLASNVCKHLVWFDIAKDFEWESARITVDNRNHYAETRFEAIGYIGNRLYVMVFCLRETTLRLISLRKANLREIKRYAQT